MLHNLRNFLHTPNWARQHGWRQLVWKGMAGIGLTGVHALPVARHWVDVQRLNMPMQNLDPAFQNFRIAQMSDLHYSPMVWANYLSQFVRWVNSFEPDLVVVTGDLITGGYRWNRGVADILKHLKAPHGVICTFGNHDYSLYGKRKVAEGKRRADHLEKSLEDRGLIVLRNQTLRLTKPGAIKPLTIVGLDDEWSGSIDPDKAYRDVRDEEAIICLNHNPANADELLAYPWQWMLSGHTHGRQIGTSRFGKHIYGHLTRQYTHGYYTVGGRHLYVNRGLSYGQRIKHWCRPEITMFRLRQMVTDAAAASGSAPSGGG